MDPSVKKIINNGPFIANLAPFISGPEAAALAAAARTHAAILSGLGIKPPLEGFDGCDQAQLLLKWIADGGDAGDADKMNEWTAEIWAAIRELANGNLPGK
jgi:hypothetical protein